MARINDIKINLVDGVNVARGAGFGVPLVVSRTSPRHIITNDRFGGLLFSGASAFKIQITVTSNASTTITKGSNATDPVVITYNGSVSTQNIITAYNSAATGVKNAVTITAPVEPGVFNATNTSGATNLTSSTFTYRSITSRDQLLGYYATTSDEYKMIANMFGQLQAPERIFVLPLASSADFETSLSARDNGEWYVVLSTAITEAENANIASYVETRERIGFIVSDDLSDLKAGAVAKNNTVRVYHTSPSDRPDAAWAAQNLPKAPGSLTWAYQANLVGQTATTATLSQLEDARTAHANSYVKVHDGLSLWQDGFIGNEGKYIDQVRGRHWIIDSIQTALLTALASEEKIPYDNRGINQIIGIVTEKLEIAGNNGLIAKIETDEEARGSSSNKWRFLVTAPTRAEITADNPSDITGRRLRNVAFSYVEAGAIHGITITGRVTL